MVHSPEASHSGIKDASNKMGFFPKKAVGVPKSSGSKQPAPKHISFLTPAKDATNRPMNSRRADSAGKAARKHLEKRVSEMGFQVQVKSPKKLKKTPVKSPRKLKKTPVKSPKKMKKSSRSDD